MSKNQFKEKETQMWNRNHIPNLKTGTVIRSEVFLSRLTNHNLVLDDLARCASEGTHWSVGKRGRFTGRFKFPEGDQN